jgi:hypothetical protein
MQPTNIEPTKPPTSRRLFVLAEIARWSWRVCSLWVMLAALIMLVFLALEAFHLVRFGDPAQLAVAVVVFGVLVAALILAWWREGLGGLVTLLVTWIALGILAGTAGHTGGKGASDSGDLLFVFCLGLPLVILLSWSLHTLSDSAAGPGKRRLALIAAPLVAIGLAFCVLLLIYLVGK